MHFVPLKEPSALSVSSNGTIFTWDRVNDYINLFVNESIEVTQRAPISQIFHPPSLPWPFYSQPVILVSQAPTPESSYIGCLEWTLLDVIDVVIACSRCIKVQSSRREACRYGLIST
jgi:hypothetical protein